MKAHIPEAKKRNTLAVCSTAEGVNIVRDSQVVVMFVKLDGESIARNNLERHKTFKFWGFGKIK